MDKVKLWGIVVSVGSILAVIGIGMAVSGSGLDEKQQVDQEWASVDNLHVYYLEMSCSGGKAVSMDYSVAAGFMTVQILTEDGLNQLVETGLASSSDVLLSRTSETSGTIEWTPPETEKYVLAFYDFSTPGSTVTVTGSFTGASSSLLYGGIGLAAVGVILAVVGFVKRRKLVKAADASKPQDIVMYPEAAPTDQAPKELPKP